MNTAMNVQSRIEAKLDESLQLLHLEVVNESGNHNVPDGSESHFKVVLVSEAFADLPLVRRHRTVNHILAEELQVIHALAVHTYTESEWRSRHGDAPMSPPCVN